jgi:hypothetical protein
MNVFREHLTLTGVFNAECSMAVYFLFIFALLVPVVPALYQQYTQQVSIFVTEHPFTTFISVEWFQG